MSVSCNMVVRFISLKEDGPFLRLRGHKAKETAEIQGMLTKLKASLDSGINCEVRVDQLYKGKVLAVRPDLKSPSWYRCQVLHLDNYKTSNLVSVKLMEYCVDIEVSLEQLRDVSTFRQPQILEQPVQSQVIYLYGVVAPKGWVTDTMERLRLKLAYANLQLQFAFEVRDKKFYHVMVNGTSLSEIIVKEGLGEAISSQDQLTLVKAHWGFPSRSAVSRAYTSPSPDFDTPPRSSPIVEPQQLFQDPSFLTSTPKTQQTAVPPTREPRIASGVAAQPGPPPGYKYPHQSSMAMTPMAAQNLGVTSPSLLPPEKSYEVAVSFIENGARLFFVQVKDRWEILGEISRRLMQQDLRSPSLLSDGMACVMKQSDSAYRGIILAMEPDCKIRLVDFGNLVPRVNLDTLFELPSEYVAMGQLAHKFCLRGLLSNPDLCNNPEVPEMFAKIVKESPQLVLKVAEADGPRTVQYCDLYRGDRSVLQEILTEVLKPPEYQFQSLDVNCSHDVIVSHVDTNAERMPWVFYVQRITDLEKLEVLLKEICQTCDGTPSIDDSKLKENCPVLAKYSIDKKWYRGLLLTKDGKNSKVFFVDYGNTEVVPLSDMRLPLKRMVTEMPAQAVKCVLDGPSSNPAASTIFDSLVVDKEFSLSTVYKLEGNIVNVRLKSADGTYINDMVIRTVIMKSMPPPMLPPVQAPEPVLIAQSSTRRPERKIYVPPNLPITPPKQPHWEDPAYLADKMNPERESHPKAQQDATSSKESGGNRKRASDYFDDELQSKRSNNIRCDTPFKPVDQVDHFEPHRDSLTLSQYNGAKGKNSNGSTAGDGNRSRDSLRDSNQSNNRGGNQRNDNGYGSQRRSSDNQGSNFGGNGERKDSFREGSQKSNTFGDSNQNKFGGDNQMKNSFGNNNQRNSSGDRGQRNDRRNSNQGQGGSSWQPNQSRGGGGRDFSDRGSEANGRQSRSESWSLSGNNFRKPSNNNDQKIFLGDGAQGNLNMGQTSTNGGNFNSGQNGGSRNSSFNNSSQPAAQIAISDDWDTPATPKISPLVIKIGETFKAMVAFIESPADFFLQGVANYSKVEEMTASVTKEFQTLATTTAFAASKGVHCWAKFPDDGLWYRAEVLEKDSSKCKVVFVDYGNKSDVVLEDIRPIKPEHASLPAQCFHCCLRGVEASDNDSFAKEVTDIELEVTIVAILNGKFSVVLKNDSVCINSVLGATAESLVPTKTVNLQKLDVDSTHTKMTISWFINPELISLHRSESCENLAADQELDATVVPKLPLSQTEVGTLVHVEVNKRLQRGIIVAVKNDKAQVELLDVGRIMVTSLRGLNALPEELATRPKQAILCGLEGVKPAEGKSWPKPGSDPNYDSIFKGNKTFSICVKSVQPSGKLEVDMTREEDGANMADLVRKGGYAAPAPAKISTAAVKEKAVPGTTWEVYVSFMQSHFKFYVQKVSDQNQLNEMQEKLQSLQSDALTDTQMNQTVLAKRESDATWYRGIVNSHNPVSIFMIDYGDCSEVSELKVLPEELAKIPAFATCCCMPMTATGLGPEIFTKLQAEVEKEFFADALTMQIIGVTNEYLMVDFKKGDGTLSERMFCEGLSLCTLLRGYVSNIASLDAIDVQETHLTDRIAEMEKALSDPTIFPKLEKYKLGDHCIAKFEDDGVYYRAQITGLENDSIEVCFHDYGNSAIVTDIRKMPDELFKVQQLTKLVKMVNAPEDEVSKEKLLEILLDSSTELLFLVLNPTSFPLDTVIFKDGVDIRKLVGTGLNVLASEFVPTGCRTADLDMFSIVFEMAEGAVENAKKSQVGVDIASKVDVLKQDKARPMKPAAEAMDCEVQKEEKLVIKEDQIKPLVEKDIKATNEAVKAELNTSGVEPLEEETGYSDQSTALLDETADSILEKSTDPALLETPKPVLEAERKEDNSKQEFAPTEPMLKDEVLPAENLPGLEKAEKLLPSEETPKVEHMDVSFDTLEAVHDAALGCLGEEGSPPKLKDDVASTKISLASYGEVETEEKSNLVENKSTEKMHAESEEVKDQEPTETAEPDDVQTGSLENGTETIITEEEKTTNLTKEVGSLAEEIGSEKITKESEEACKTNHETAPETVVAVLEEQTSSLETVHEETVVTTVEKDLPEVPVQAEDIRDTCQVVEPIEISMSVPLDTLEAAEVLSDMTTIESRVEPDLVRETEIVEPKLTEPGQQGDAPAPTGEAEDQIETPTRPLEEFVFKEPLPVFTPRGGEDRSLHSSDMSLDESSDDDHVTVILHDSKAKEEADQMEDTPEVAAKKASVEADREDETQA